ncbi:MAG: acyclic terpene utilization AtuA family protein, partial [Deltaproteobacteria bacterium]|nr:acyclic terpene utilization AtuA family protein [Deltaproteobacteria bacterium]
IVTPATVGEQLLYEIGDPQAYLLPDVVCDFSKVKIVQVGDNQVEVTGVIGQPPPECYKVYSAYQDGYRCFAISPVIGMNAVQKAERMAEALIKRTRLLFQQQNLGDYRDTLVECIGAESAYGPHARSRDTREVACKISLEHERPEALQIFASEAYAPTTSMSPGTTGWFVGKPYVSPIIRLFSFLIPKNEVPFTITLNDNSRSFTQSPTEVFNPASIIRPRVADITDAGAEMKTVPLVQLAWGRSGDKGNSCNIGIMARKPEFLPYIRKVLTESAVYEFMNHIFHGAEKPGVERFDLPGINALNFLLHESLGGGQMASLRLDPLAKGMAQQLLEFPTPVPVSLL